MNRTERFAREAHFTAGAKVVSIIFTVGITALLVARTPLYPGEETMVSAPPAFEQSKGDVGAFGSTLGRQEADAAARVAKQDDPPIATF